MFAVLERLLEHRTLVVLGCGGWDDVFVSTLASMVADTESAPDVLWTLYESDANTLQTRYSHLFSALAPGIARSRVIFYSGIDLHAFIPKLLERMRATGPGEEPDEVRILLERLLELAPELREKITEKLNPELLDEVDKLQQRHKVLEEELRNTKDSSAMQIAKLKSEKEALDHDLKIARGSLTRAEITLAGALMRDVSWLQMIRTTLMPREPGRVPFHNSAEVAIRGFNTANTQQAIPELREVTWSKLPYREKYHRGYYAGLIFHGSNFAPGVTFASRKIGESSATQEQTDYWFREPNIYFGDYLEVAAGDREPESPLGYREMEFCVRNPNGKTSKWVPFSYHFDDAKLELIYRDSRSAGESLIAQGRYREAIEPLRRAWVFVQRLPSIASDMAVVEERWKYARDMAVRVTLRFVEGTRIRVSSGPHTGAGGVVEKIQTNQTRPYWVRLATGELEAFADENLEGVPS